MMTRLLVGMFTPAIRAIGPCSMWAAPGAAMKGPRVRWRPALAESPKHKRPVRAYQAARTQTALGWRAYRGARAARQQAAAAAIHAGRLRRNGSFGKPEFSPKRLAKGMTRSVTPTKAGIQRDATRRRPWALAFVGGHQSFGGSGRP